MFYPDRRTNKPLSEKAAADAKRVIHLASSLIDEEGNFLFAKSWCIADADLCLMLQVFRFCFCSQISQNVGNIFLIEKKKNKMVEAQS